MKLLVEFDTDVSPQRVIDALLDFTPRRPRLWPSLDAKYYAVHHIGETSAEVTEGNIGRPKLWSRERYDWSVPGRVEWRAVESNFCVPGGGVVVQVTPREGGGSHLVMEWERQAKNWRGHFATFVVRIGGERMMKFGMRRALANIDEVMAAEGFRA